MEASGNRFMRTASKAAKAIREGGLKEDSTSSQIEERAWKLLEKINSEGLITYDSQSGNSLRERAYVKGFMQVEKVEAFVKNLNLWSDKVAFYSLPIAEAGSQNGAFWSSIPVTKDYQAETGWVGFTSMPLYQTEDMMKIERGQAGLPPRFPAIVVTVFDPKWGRAAWSKNGLFRDVLEALTPPEHPRDELGDDTAQ